MCGVKIRRMTKVDIPALALLEQKNFSEPWSAASFDAELSNPHGITLVAEKERAVVGYLNGHLVCENLHINTFCVAEEARGKGIASFLMTFLLQLALSSEAEEITLEVRQGNEPAMELYRKFGFFPAGVRKQFYKKPTEDAVLMKKELNCDKDTWN